MHSVSFSKVPFPMSQALVGDFFSFSLPVAPACVPAFPPFKMGFETLLVGFIVVLHVASSSGVEVKLTEQECD